MSCYRKNIRIGTKDPLWGTDDIANKSITKEKLADGSVSEQKLSEELKDWIIGGAGIPDAPDAEYQYARRKGNWEKVEGMTPEERQALKDLEAEVFPLAVKYVSNNAGTYEIGTRVQPTGTMEITRHGKDVAEKAEILVTSDVTVSGNKKTWQKTAMISSGSWSQKVGVVQGGQTKELPNLTWNFANYRYRGEVSAEPTNYATAIKALATQELSNATTLGSTALSANKYYLFAVVGLTNFVVRHAQTGGEISGCKTGNVSIARKNGTGSEVYSYVLVPKSSSNWNFTISNS